MANIHAMKNVNIKVTYVWMTDSRHFNRPVSNVVYLMSEIYWKILGRTEKKNKMFLENMAGFTRRLYRSNIKGWMRMWYALKAIQTILSNVCSCFLSCLSVNLIFGQCHPRGTNNATCFSVHIIWHATQSDVQGILRVTLQISIAHT